MRDGEEVEFFEGVPAGVGGAFSEGNFKGLLGARMLEKTLPLRLAFLSGLRN